MPERLRVPGGRARRPRRHHIVKDARLRALEARTGEERWSYPIGDAASCGGVPVRITSAPDGYVYISAGTRVLAVNMARRARALALERPAVFLSPPTLVPRAPRSREAASTSPTTSARCTPSTRRTVATAGAVATEARSSIDPVLVAAGHVHRRQRQGVVHPRRGHRHPGVALPGRGRPRGRARRRRGPHPLRLHGPSPLHPEGGRRAASVEAGDGRGDHRCAGGQGRGGVACSKDR